MDRSQSLKLHLDSNFYPPLPETFKNKFVKVFEEYWNAGDIDWLQTSLNEIGYKGDLNSYGFFNFLNEEDVYE
jgi:hypothetical protein